MRDEFRFRRLLFSNQTLEEAVTVAGRARKVIHIDQIQIFHLRGWPAPASFFAPCGDLTDDPIA